MAAITKPELPPKAGYIEVEVGGKRIYQPTIETIAKLKLEQDSKNTASSIENALCEIDSTYNDRLAAIEDALCELDMGGNI